MTSRHAVALALAALLTSCDPHPAPQADAGGGYTLIVFADVTGSLEPTQAADIRQLFATLVQQVDSETKVEAYTITKNAGGDHPFYEGTGLSDVADVARIQAANSKLDKAVEFLKGKYADLRHQGEKQTCILSSLAVTTQRLAVLREAHQHTTVVYLSDMLEDCAKTPAGTSIVLEKTAQEFAHEQSLLERIPAQPNGLRGATVRAILPGLVLDGAIVHLTTFWKTALSRYGLEQQQVAEFQLWRNQLPSGLSTAQTQ
jgi:hypothetical protein